MHKGCDIMKHFSVLKEESIKGLNVNPDGIYVDATLGYGGHAKEVQKRLKRGILFAFDEDMDAINYCKKNYSFKNVEYIHSNFVNMKHELQKKGIEKVDGIIFDLGVSSVQIDEPERGFSFMKDAPLDMRMNKDKDFSAQDVVNKYSTSKLIDIFFKYGEEKYSKSIAKNIVANRPIDTTLNLVNIIKASVPTKYFNEKHPERRIFQAIRIEVNDELNVIEKVLPDAISLLNSGGRICVITFHSLEDRIVKNTFKKYSEDNSLLKGTPETNDQRLIKLINKKPILPSDEELTKNSRSASAKLRIVERI